MEATQEVLLGAGQPLCQPLNVRLQRQHELGKRQGGGGAPGGWEPHSRGLRQRSATPAVVGAIEGKERGDTPHSHA